MTKEELCWEWGCAVLPCWRKVRGQRCPPKDAPLSVMGLRPLPPGIPRRQPPPWGGGRQKNASKTPPSAGRKKKERGEKEGERRWGVCGRVRRRENAGGPGVSKEPSHKGIAHRTLPGKKIPYFSLQSYYKRAEEIYSRYNKRAHRGPSSSSVKRTFSQKKINSVGLPTVPYTCRKLLTVQKS